MVNSLPNFNAKTQRRKVSIFNFAPLPFVFEFDVSSIGYYQAEILPSSFPFILALMQQLGIVPPVG
jgi:hypothetical protein